MAAKKSAEKIEEVEERIAAKIKEATDSVKMLIHSIATTTEKRIALEDIINNISREAESMLDQADYVSKVNQKKLLLAYRRFLEQNLAAVDHRIKELEE
ncbi:hypothetical protein [Nitrososphaera sp.]|uniref:hypothetical protein n=1 Tax=Nitrososphaera sp. TaxID=1971748 RepID=UPI00307E248D